MPKDWKEISDDELLNFDSANTADIARFDRIMQKRSQESLLQTQKEISNLSSHIGGSTDRLVGVGNRLIQTLENDAQSQGKHQKAIFVLTIVIAMATVAYTGITWKSVQTMQESNQLQRQMIQSNETPLTSQSSIQPAAVGTSQSAAPN